MTDKVIDGQGNEVVIGHAYKFTFAMPGPDTTVVIAKEINDDGTVKCYDVYFKIELKSVKGEKLFRPIKFPFKPQDVELITTNGGVA